MKNPWEGISLSDYEHMMNIGYTNIETKEYPLPNGKKLVRLDYMK